MEKLSFDNKTLRKFGFTMGTAVLAVALILVVRHRHNVLPVALLSAVFFVLGMLFPTGLRTVYTAWMKFAFVLAWFNTRLLLCVLFYFVFTPLGLVARLFGADLLDRKLQKDKQSYWQAKEKRPFTTEEYEHQF